MIYLLIQILAKLALIRLGIHLNLKLFALEITIYLPRTILSSNNFVSLTNLEAVPRFAIICSNFQVLEWWIFQGSFQTFSSSIHFENCSWRKQILWARKSGIFCKTCKFMRNNLKIIKFNYKMLYFGNS